MVGTDVGVESADREVVADADALAVEYDEICPETDDSTETDGEDDKETDEELEGDTETLIVRHEAEADGVTCREIYGELDLISVLDPRGVILRYGVIDTMLLYDADTVGIDARALGETDTECDAEPDVETDADADTD